MCQALFKNASHILIYLIIIPTPYETDITIMPLFQGRKLRHREVSVT